MEKFDFLDSENIPVDIDICKKISKEIDKLILTNLVTNSSYLDLFYLRLYMVSVTTRYISMLQTTDRINSRADMQKALDAVMSLSLIVVADFGSHEKLEMSVSLFINQLLLLAYDNVDNMCVSPSNLHNYIIDGNEDLGSDGVHNRGVIAIIEPIITKPGRRKIEDMNKALDIVNTFYELFDYNSKMFKVFVAVIVSDLWVEEIDKPIMVKNAGIDDMLPNNNINMEDFSEFRQFNLKAEYNIDVDMIVSENDEYDSQEAFADYISDATDIFNEINEAPNSTGSIDYQNEADFNLNVNMNLISEEIEKLFCLIHNIEDGEIYNDSDIPDAVTYKSMYDIIYNSEKNILGTHLLNDTIKTIYSGTNAPKKEKPKSKKNIKKRNDIIKLNIDMEELYNSIIGKSKFDVTDEELDDENYEFDLIENEEEEDNTCNLEKLLKFNTGPDSDGYYCYATSDIDDETNKFVIHFSDYVNDMLKILKKKKINYDKKMLLSIATSYNKKDNFKVDKINKRKELFNIIIQYKDTEMILTANSNCDIISNIRCKNLVKK